MGQPKPWTTLWDDVVLDLNETSLSLTILATLASLSHRASAVRVGLQATWCWTWRRPDWWRRWPGRCRRVQTHRWSRRRPRSTASARRHGPFHDRPTSCSTVPSRLPSSTLDRFNRLVSLLGPNGVFYLPNPNQERRTGQRGFKWGRKKRNGKEIGNREGEGKGGILCSCDFSRRKIPGWNWQTDKPALCTPVCRYKRWRRLTDWR